MTTDNPAAIRGDGQADLTMTLVMHGASGASLARAASHHHTDDPARHAAILAGWQLYKTALVFHHEGEDSDLWPRAHPELVVMAVHHGQSAAGPRPRRFGVRRA